MFSVNPPYLSSGEHRNRHVDAHAFLDWGSRGKSARCGSEVLPELSELHPVRHRRAARGWGDF